VDIDPVMLAIGRGAIGTIDGRLRWIQADLASPDWLEELGETQVDAVLSTTALHWLPPEPLARLYRDLGRLLRPGGLVLNGDHLDFDPASPRLARLSLRVREEQWTDAAFAARGIETAEQWWARWPRNLRSHRCSPSGPGASPARRARTHHPASTSMWRRCATPASARWTRSGRRSRIAWC
jgi:SAM-dependent methyltransferase